MSIAHNKKDESSFHAQLSFSSFSTSVNSIQLSMFSVIFSKNYLVLSKHCLLICIITYLWYEYWQFGISMNQLKEKFITTFESLSHQKDDSEQPQINGPFCFHPIKGMYFKFSHPVTVWLNFDQQVLIVNT